MDLLDTMKRINEAYCVQRGIPVQRQYRDDELTGAHTALRDAERDVQKLSEEGGDVKPGA